MEASAIYTPKVTFSIVVYKQTVEELSATIQSVLQYNLPKVIYIVDNSPQDTASQLTQISDCIIYHHIPQNVGFGKAHNWAIEEAIKNGSQFHFIVNPDIYFKEDIVSPMLTYMEIHPDVGLMMPRILHPNGKTQFLPKLMPSPKMLIQRRLRSVFRTQHEKWMKKFEMRSMRDDQIYEVGHISGCFSLFRTEALKRCGTYDERFFMYFEDTDLSRRIHQHYKTIYFPFVSVYHLYGNAASKSWRMFSIFIYSLCQYFNKWGWFFDKERNQCNAKFLKQLDN